MTAGCDFDEVKILFLILTFLEKKLVRNKSHLIETALEKLKEGEENQKCQKPMSTI